MTATTTRDAAIRARIRRLYAPGASYFITGVTEKRRMIFHDDRSIALLRQTMREVKKHHPFFMRAYVVLPDHFHLLLRVHESTNISKVLHAIKRNFTLNHKRTNGTNSSAKLWQRGFWDHVIRDDRDYLNHINYIHYNPVKHGLVARAGDYRHSSFHHYLRLGWYDLDWGSVEPDEITRLNFE